MSAESDERGGLPSASDTAFWNCPGQRNLFQEIKPEPEPTNPDAERGTRIHDAFQTENVSELSSEEFDTYKRGTEFLENLLIQWRKDFSIVSYEEMPREKRYWMVSDQFVPMTSAKLDRHFIGKDAKGNVHALVADLKSGFVPNLVAAPKSTQLRVQLVCMVLDIGDIGDEIVSTRVAYVKPKRFEGFRDYCDYSKEDIGSAIRWVQTHLWESKKEEAQRIPGKHCDHCPVKAWCREAGAYAMLPVSIVGTADVEARIRQMSAIDLVKIWESQSIITKILKAVSTRLKNLSPEELESLGVVRGKGSETPEITKVAECVEYLRSRTFTDEEIYSCMEFSTTKVANIFRKNVGLSSDEKAKEYTKKVLEPFITIKTAEAPLKKL